MQNAQFQQYHHKPRLQEPAIAIKSYLLHKNVYSSY